MMMMRYRWPVFATLCLAVFFCFGVALAESETQSDESTPESTRNPESQGFEDEILVSASLVETPRSRSGNSVTVITRSEIEQHEKTTVAELLRQVRGVEVVTTGGAGGATSVFIRGANSSHTLVLIDGVRVNSPMTGSYDWADLTTDQIEQIEVARGPQSALYGSEAIGGVVSIVSRQGVPGAELQARLETGSNESHRLVAQSSGARGAWNWSVGASHQESESFSRASTANGNTEDDPWENFTLSGRVGRSLRGDSKIVASARYIDSATALDGFDFFAGPVDDLGYDQDREQLMSSVSADLHLSDRWRQKVRLGFVSEDLEVTNTDPNLEFLNSLTETTTGSIDLVTDVTFSERESLSFGFAFEQRDAESRFNFDESVDIVSVFAENRLAMGEALFLSLSVRHDDHSVYGGETTGRASLSWNIPDSDTRFHGSWGTGFKAPTFIDLYFPFYGNQNLQPETSSSYELGVEQIFGGSRWFFDGTFFSTSIDNLIVFDFGTFLAGNVANAEIEGFELELKWKPNSVWSTAATYTQTDSEDLETGSPLARRPKHRTVVSLSYAPTRRLDAVLTYLGVRDRFDTGGVALDDYDRVDATLNYRFGSSWSAFLRGRNIFDEEYEEVAGYTSAGAEVSVGLRLTR